VSARPNGNMLTILPRAYSSAQHSSGILYLCATPRQRSSLASRQTRAVFRHSSAPQRERSAGTHCLNSPNLRWCWSPGLYTSLDMRPATCAHCCPARIVNQSSARNLPPARPQSDRRR
jgi:hypothetical protein